MVSSRIEQFSLEHLSVIDRPFPSLTLYQEIHFESSAGEFSCIFLIDFKWNHLAKCLSSIEHTDH